jgi:hypothetical protein
MKTKEQVQQELNTYLTKTSQHVFVAGEKNDRFLRVVETTTKDGEKIWFSIWLDENLEPKSIDRSVDVSRYDDPNSKCWVKHSLFLNREMKSVKLKKKTQWIADALVSVVSELSKPPMMWKENRDYMENLLDKLKMIKKEEV